MPNPYEHSARAAKVDEIVDYLDRMFLDLGCNPHSHLALDSLMSWPELYWQEAARQAGQKELKTRDADGKLVTVGVILERYRRRIAAAREDSGVFDDQGNRVG